MIERRAVVPAYAKINLGLRVLYKRPDDYHELRTVFQTISLADTLEITWRPAGITSIEIEGTPEIADNLVARAARLVLERASLTGDFHCVLRKKIPSGAGLGGGSSDAAAVLIALSTLAGCPLATHLAGQLGSDVPFFLHGGTALGFGRGEELYPVPERALGHGLLVAPAIHSSTPQAYRDLSSQLTSNTLQNKLESFQQEIWQEGASGSLAVNDFEEVVFARHPELRKIKNRFLDLGARTAAMSGSGSSIFGFFETIDEAVQAQAEFRDYPCFPISLVNREKYRSEWAKALVNHTQGNLWPLRSRYVR